ncbi:MAG: NAD(P)-dependent oxidoreductase [Pseudolabrys sp.]
MASRLVQGRLQGDGVRSVRSRPPKIRRRRRAATAKDTVEAVKNADVVITLLPDGKIVKAALEGLRKSLKPGCVIMEMSSSEPVATRALGKASSRPESNSSTHRSPVESSAPTDGSLAIMVGGADSTIDRVSALLNAMGKSIFRTGVLGSGHAMKAPQQLCVGRGLVAAVEAIAIGEKFGLKPELMTDILNVSTGRNNTTEVKLKPFIISKAFNAGFPMKLMAKDVRTADSLAHAIGVPSPLADIVAKLWDDASQALGPAADHTAIGQYIEKMKPLSDVVALQLSDLRFTTT